MPRFYPDGIFHFSEDKHVAELKHKCRQAFFRIISLVKTGTKFYSGLGVLHGFLRDKCILFGWEKECESFSSILWPKENQYEGIPSNSFEATPSGVCALARVCSQAGKSKMPE